MSTAFSRRRLQYLVQYAHSWMANHQVLRTSKARVQYGRCCRGLQYGSRVPSHASYLLIVAADKQPFQLTNGDSRQAPPWSATGTIKKVLDPVTQRGTRGRREITRYKGPSWRQMSCRSKEEEEEEDHHGPLALEETSRFLQREVARVMAAVNAHDAHESCRGRTARFTGGG